MTTEEDAGVSPLAKKLFGVKGVGAVMLGSNFVTVTKGPDGTWDEIHKGSMDTIREHLEQGLEILDPNYEFPTQEASADDSEVVQKIKKILDEEIRPAVAMDGGDIIFEKYENNVVFLSLQGSCHGCPSSVMTLKMGIETRLQAAIPEIREVVPI